MKKTNAQAVTWRKGYIVTGVLAFVLILLAVMPLGVSAAVDCCHHPSLEAFEWQDEQEIFGAFEPLQQTSMPRMDLTNNRPTMLVFLLETEDIQFNDFYLTPQFPTHTSYWSNTFFGETGDTVNEYFREVSHDFNLQFVPPTFINENDDVIDTLLLENPAPRVNKVLIQDNVVRVRVDELRRPDGLVDGALANLLFDIIWPFIDCSNIPRTIGQDGRQLILVEELLIYFIRAGNHYASGSAAVGQQIINGHRRPFSVLYLPERTGLASYGMNREWNGQQQLPRQGFPVTIHEIGHMLGLPDFRGMGGLTLPGSNMITHFDAWSKKMLGFVEPTVIHVSPGMDYQIVYMHSANADEPYNIVKITSDAHYNQYFLLENRQRAGFDRDLARHILTADSGILILHIDEDVLLSIYPSVSVEKNDNWMHRAIAPIVSPESASAVYQPNPFFTANGRNMLGLNTDVNSNFFQPGHTRQHHSNVPVECHPRTLPSNIEIRVLCNSGPTMRVKIMSTYIVYNVTITPPYTVVAPGSTQQFYAYVSYTHGAHGAFEWSLSGNLSANTTISENGLLSVCATESAVTELVVTARSTFNPDRYDIARVNSLIAQGTLGTGGAPWKLLTNGTVLVDEGRVMPDFHTVTPWVNYQNQITKIIFTHPVTVENTLAGLFSGLESLESIEGLENLDTSNATDMSAMFRGAVRLTSLDLSSFDTRNVVHMNGMFEDAANLRKLTLGENFQFRGTPQLPPIPTNSSYTGYWQNVGIGVVDHPLGQFVFTSEQLMSKYSGATMAGTFVWQPCFAGQPISAQGTLGTGGAPWTLFADGTVRVGEGRIMSDFRTVTPWRNFRVYRIIFTSPVTVENTLFTLFGSLPYLTTIVGLENLDTSNATNMGGMFSQSRSLTSLDLSSFDTSNVTSMDRMFYGASSLTSLDLSSFDTSNVTNMWYMFSGTQSLTNLDLSHFDTSSVTNMSNMFLYAHGLTILDLSSFTTSNVTNMSNMFFNANSLTNLDLSSFDTRNVVNTVNMFNRTTSLRSLNLGANFVSKGDTNLHPVPANDAYTGYWRNIGAGTASNPLGQFILTSHQLMSTFNGATMAGTFVWQPVLAEQPIVAQGTLGTGGASWTLLSNGTVLVGEGRVMPDFITVTPWRNYRNRITKIIFTGSVTAENTLAGLFATLGNLEIIEGLEKLDTSNATSMLEMFMGTGRLASLDLSNFDTNNVTNMGRMFSETHSLTSLNVSSFDTSNVMNMSSMFNEARSLTSLNVSNFDTSNVTNMSNMFFGAQSLTTLNLSNFDTNSVTNMSAMFMGASGLTNLDLSSFNTLNVTNMSNMFRDVSRLASLNMSSFDTRNVTSMTDMFTSMHSLISLDVSHFNTSNVTNMGNMFSNTRSLASLDVSNFDTSNVTSMSNMFNSALSLTSLDLSSFDTRNVVHMNGMFDRAWGLRNLTLGANFVFTGNPQLPPVSTNDTYTGYWRNIGTGTASDPQGEFVLTSQQLMSSYDGTTMAGTFVWQPRPVSPTAHQIALDIYTDNEYNIDMQRDYETPDVDDNTDGYCPDYPVYYETPDADSNAGYYCPGYPGHTIHPIA